MEAKDELIQGFRAQMLSMTSFTEAQISHVESILHVAMADYDVTRQERTKLRQYHNGNIKVSDRGGQQEPPRGFS